MRELRLKYIINLVSDLASKSQSDEKALTQAQKHVQDALAKSTREAGLLERALVRMAGLGARSADQQAGRLVYLAKKYQEVRKAAEGAANAMQTATKVATGAAAGGYAVDRMAKAPMEYSLRLAHMANTAYADRDAAGRIAGKRTLNAAISAATRTGGGSRDDAAGALDTLIASGAVSPEQAMRLLPMLMRGSTASGATPDQLAGIALRGMQTFDIGLGQVPELINMAMAAGQAGGFELKDMSRWLPQAMAAGRLSGLTGMEGMRRIIGGMQAGVIVAGSKDEAGNNMVNLLAKINSRDTAIDLAKMGIDLPSELAAQRDKGVNSLDAFVGIVDAVASKDAEYTALKSKLDKAGSKGERASTLAAMTDILQGKAIGKVIQDRQALMQLVAEMNNREYIGRVMDTTRRNTGAIGTSFDVVSQEVAFARQQALNEATAGAQRAFDAAAPALGGVANAATDLAREFPVLTTMVVGASGALVAFTAALGASGLIGMLTGRAGNAGGVLTTAATVGAGAVAATLATPARMTNAGLWARQLGGTFLPVVGAGVDAWQVSNDPTLTDAGKRRGYAGAAAGTAAAWALAKAGAAAGTAVLPGWGTAIGGVGGGLVGYFGGREALNWLWEQDPARDLVGPDGNTLASTAGRVELGSGQIDLNVRVQDDRITWEMASQGTPALQLQAGATNPGGYGSTR